MSCNSYATPRLRLDPGFMARSGGGEVSAQNGGFGRSVSCGGATGFTGGGGGGSREAEAGDATATYGAFTG